MIEPTTTTVSTAAAGGAVTSAALVQWLGVSPPSLIGAVCGTILALHISDSFPTIGKAVTGAFSSFAIGVFGGQWASTMPLFAGAPTPVLCFACAAIGLKSMPFFIDGIGALIKKFTGGGNV